MDSGAKRGWAVWKVHQDRSISPEEAQRLTNRPWGCVGGMLLALLLLLALSTALTALFLGQWLPVLVLFLGHLWLILRFARVIPVFRKPCPDTGATALFLGELTERGIRMASGHLAPWSAFSGWAPGWEDNHVFRIQLKLAPEETTRALIRMPNTGWRFLSVVAGLAGLCLALQLPGHNMALLACLYTVSLHLTFFVLSFWAKAGAEELEKAAIEEPWILICDTRQVSLAEVEARLDRYLPRI